MMVLSIAAGWCLLSGLWSCWLVFAHAGGLCHRQRVDSGNVTTELWSDVLLPCYFEPVLLGSDMTADIVAVWTQKNEAIPNLLEITLQGDVRSWNNKGGRIKTFSKLSESGNFSILLHKVNQSDQGFYRCELFKGFNCSIAYQEMQLDIAKVFHYRSIIVTGASGGAVLLLLFIACAYYIRCKRKILDNPLYGNYSREGANYSREGANYSREGANYSRKEGTVYNPIYTNLVYQAQPARGEASRQLTAECGLGDTKQ